MALAGTDQQPRTSVGGGCRLGAVLRQSEPLPIVFQNIGSGAEQTLTGWLPGGSIVPDLDSRTLGRPLCPHLRVPDAWNYTGETQGPGDLTFFGGFALARGTTRPTAPGGITTATYLERCGTHLHIKTPWQSSRGSSDIAGNQDAIVSVPGSASNPTGLFLPSLQRFSINVESFLATTSFHLEYNAVESYQLFLTKHRMYLMAPYPAPGCGNHPADPCPPTPAQLWLAPAPGPPRKK